VGSAILATLCAVALLVYLKQLRYDPALFRATSDGTPRPTASASASAPSQSDFSTIVPAGFAAMGAPEAFGKDTLSDKIDGKAELYLECGFVNLDCQRFGDAKNPAAWFELFVYDMGTPLNAFAVFSNQRRSDGRESNAAQFAYSAGSSLFVAHGRHYIEAVAAENSQPLAAAIAETCRNFVAKNPAAKAEMSALAFLPAEGMHRNSVTLLLKDAFGFDKFDNVVTADYGISGTTVTGFLSVRKSPEEAAALAGAYQTMLTRDMGGDTVDTTSATVPGLKMASMLGDHEMVFAAGAVVAGVHAAKSRQAGEALVARLAAAIREKAK
jgi:hypothetical protein